MTQRILGQVYALYKKYLMGKKVTRVTVEMVALSFGKQKAIHEPAYKDVGSDKNLVGNTTLDDNDLWEAFSSQPSVQHSSQLRIVLPHVFSQLDYKLW